jgi:signal peptidase II
LKRYIRDYLVLFLMAGVIIALDQASKSWIRANLGVGEVWNPIGWLAPYARLVHWYNTGVAFGMFQGVGQVFKYLTILVALIIIYYYPRVSPSDWTLRLAMGMQLGGALGNLIDRITIGHVTDFISVGNFPVFNIADSSISVGVVILIIGVWLQERKTKKLAENIETSASENLLDEDKPKD